MIDPNMGTIASTKFPLFSNVVSVMAGSLSRKYLRLLTKELDNIEYSL